MLSTAVVAGTPVVTLAVPALLTDGALPGRGSKIDPMDAGAAVGREGGVAKISASRALSKITPDSDMLSKINAMKGGTAAGMDSGTAKRSAIGALCKNLLGATKRSPRGTLSDSRPVSVNAGGGGELIPPIHQRLLYG